MTLIRIGIFNRMHLYNGGYMRARLVKSKVTYQDRWESLNQ